MSRRFLPVVGDFGPLAVPLVIVTAMIAMFLGQYACQDDPITAWVSLWSSDFGATTKRAVETSHLPTYYWIARVLGIALGGLEGIRLGSTVAWVGTIVTIYFLLRHAAPGTLAPLVGAVFAAADPFFVFLNSCARPYSWLLLFVALSIYGLFLVTTRRGSIGLPLLAAAAGLMFHMSATTLLTAAMLLAFGVWKARGQSIGFPVWLIVIAIVLILFAPAIFKAATLVTPHLAGAASALAHPACSFWMGGMPLSARLGGMPLTSQWSFVIIPIVLGLWIVLGRRFGILGKLDSPFLTNNNILCLVGIALVHPIAVVVAGWIFELPVFAVWYHSQEFVFRAVFVAIGIGTISSTSVQRLIGAIYIAGFMSVSVWLTSRAIETNEVFDYRYRYPVLDYIRDHGELEDLVVVVSTWPEAFQRWRYGSRRGIEYLLSDIYLREEYRRMRLFPAPQGMCAIRGWADAVAMRAASGRIWFVNQISYSALWNDDVSFGPGWALTELNELGFADAKQYVPEEYEDRVYVLEHEAKLAQ